MMTERAALDGDLDRWTWDATKDDFVSSGSEIPADVAEEIGVMQDAARSGMDREQFDRLVGAERFAETLAKVTRWTAKVKGVQSIALDETDPAYSEAAEVVYRRVMDGPGRFLLPYLSHTDLVDIWIVAMFAVPYFGRVASEIKAKRKAKKSKPTAEDPPEAMQVVGVPVVNGEQEGRGNE